MVRDKKIKGWFLTYPKCDRTKEELLQWLCLIDNVSEYVICREKHEDGTYHLHAHVKFETGIMKKNFREFDFNGDVGHYEQTKSREKAIKYCKKDGDYITNLDDDTILSPEKKRAKFISETLTKKTVGEMVRDGDIHFSQARAAAYAKQLLDEPYEHNDVRGLWIQGKPGVGKTRYVRDTYGHDLYFKAMNKWFDGYTGQKYIVLDDFEKTAGPMLSWYMKRWLDRYEVAGETKGAHVNLRHHLFIITTNYTITECFGHDDELVQAISRRCKIINM